MRVVSGTMGMVFRKGGGTKAARGLIGPAVDGNVSVRGSRPAGAGVFCGRSLPLPRGGPGPLEEGD